MTTNYLLTEEHINYLRSIGFIVEHGNHSGYWFRDTDCDTEVLIPLTDGTFKLETYSTDYADDVPFQNYGKTFSNNGQTLQDFIQ